LKAQAAEKKSPSQEKIFAKVKIGDRFVPAFGLGTLPIGVLYNKGGRPSRESAVQLIVEALNLGLRFIDTSDVYCANSNDMHYSEEVIRDALLAWDGDISDVCVATKGGMARFGDGDTSNSWREVMPFTPTKLRACVQASKKALGGTQPIALWQFHHANAYAADDKEFHDLMKAASELIAGGEVGAIGLCNCGVAHIKVASKYFKVATVQNEFNLWERKCWIGKVSGAKSNQGGVIPYCVENGITFMPYGALGGNAARNGRRDLVQDFPGVVHIAKAKGVSPHALVLAWMRAKFPNILHIVGLRELARLEGIREAHGISLTPTEVETIAAMKKPPAARKP